MNSSIYNEKIATLTTQYNFLIADFIKYYVFTNKNPSVNEYKNLYNNNIQQIQLIFDDLVALKTNIEAEVSQMNSYVELITTEINNNVQIYDNLFTEKKQSSNTRDGSVFLIDESKELYNTQYYLNVELWIGIIILIFISVYIYRSDSSHLHDLIKIRPTKRPLHS